MPSIVRPLRGAATTRNDESRQVAVTTPLQRHARYQSHGLLGMGGIGQVEHAFDLRLQRDVAIKTLRTRPGRELSSSDAERLRREARIACQLEHPNILTVYELLEDAEGQAAALVMRFVDGETLLVRLGQLGPALDNQTVLQPMLDALLQVCDAVAFAHAQRILHLDLKPENVMVDKSGHAYVLDWGEAAQGTLNAQGNLRPLEQSRETAGTRLYMAPEQFESGTPRVDQRTDIYALGGILHHALCGKAPFQDVEAERNGDHPPFIVPSIVPVVRTPIISRLSAVAMRAMAYDPAQRYQSVSALRDEIRSIAREESFLLPLHVAQGTCIVREGDAADSAYIVLEGECSVRRRVGDQDVSVAAICAGETFGESALLEHGLRAASVVATSAVTLLAFDRTAIRQALGVGWVGTFMKTLVARSNRSDPLPRARMD